MKITKRKAFTLIELLVVIAIIALLTAILMPALNRVKMQANSIVCRSNLKSLSLAWYAYTVDNDGVMVGGDVKSGDSYPGWVGAPQKEDGSYYPYPGGEAPIEAEIRGIEKGLLFPYAADVDVYHCPADKKYKRVQIGYGNTFRSYAIADSMNGINYYIESLKKYTQIKTPASKYVFVEEEDVTGVNFGSWVMPSLKAYSWHDPLAIWHNKGIVLGFADGHAEIHKWVDESTIEGFGAGVLMWPVSYDEDTDWRYMQRCYARKERIPIPWD